MLKTVNPTLFSGRSAYSSNCTTPTMTSPHLTPTLPQTLPVKGMTPMSSWSSLPQVNGNAGSIRSNHWQASSLPPTSAGSLCSYNSLPQSRITTSPDYDSFGGNGWEATSTGKSTTPPRMASFTL